MSGKVDYTWFENAVARARELSKKLPAEYQPATKLNEALDRCRAHRQAAVKKAKEIIRDTRKKK